MRNLFLCLVFLMGCNTTTPPPLVVVVTADADMGNSSDMLTAADLAQTQGDMAQANQPDMLTSTDMTQTPDMVNPCTGGDVMCAGFCTNTQTSVNNCGGCGNVCGGNSTCVSGACIYTHHDTFCSDTWTDDSPTVDSTSLHTASAACVACCKKQYGINSSACNLGCTAGSQSSGGNTAAYYYFNYPSTGPAYVFYYHDDTGLYGAGKAVIDNSSTGTSTPVWWAQ